MSVTQATTSAPERDLLDRARNGDEGAFGSLMERHRGELHAHCYRMLGSVHDAEDAYQDAMLRAWRGLARFDGRGSLRGWLYRICTNTCLDIIGKRPKRVLPVDYGPPTDPHQGPGAPITESVWIEPYPDGELGVEDDKASPDARYELRESVELAFIAALQHLPPRQRAVLVLREVLGFSAKEVAESLETSTASVNSALQRARKTLDDRLPDQTQQATMRSLGDERVREVVETYVDAWERDDVDTVVSLLTEEAAFAMPPLGSWFRGHEALRTFLAGWPLSGAWRWRHIKTHANGQPAMGYYAWDESEQAYLPFALNVLTFEGDRICDVTAFVVRSIEPTDDEAYHRWPDQPTDPRRFATTFASFGLPERLT
jgi:RNA polymerase sigma-70 factor (ECF subfamily)